MTTHGSSGNLRNLMHQRGCEIKRIRHLSTRPTRLTDSERKLEKDLAREDMADAAALVFISTSATCEVKSM